MSASSVTIGAEARRAPRNVEEALRGEILTAAQTAAARNFVNEISGSTRMMAHGLLYVGKGNLPYIEEQTEKKRARFVEGLQHLQRGQDRRRSQQPDAAVAA